MKYKQIFWSTLLTILFTPSLASADTRYPNALPDLRISKGNNDIREAWFSHPTTRYQHFVLGSRYEAGVLNVRTKNGKHLTFKLPTSSVFEDRIPRLNDLDNDGRDEIVVVRAYLKGGAALSIFGIVNGRLKLLAETPDMGHPFGWLNPAGIADFDGDGNKEIAFVRKPHVLGRLELWRYQSGQIKRIATASNTSNHTIGSKNLGLSMVGDFNGDGIKDLALPSKDRLFIRFLSFKGGVKEISKKRLRKRAASDFRIVTGKGKMGVAVGLEDGTSVIVMP